MPRKLIFFLYRALGAAAFPLFLLYVLWRVARNRRYPRGFRERLGFLPRSIRPTAPGCVWLHAVSVGEIFSAVTLVKALRAAMPGVRVYVSCTTLAGREVADARLTGTADGVFYAPVDYVWAVRRTLRTLQPILVLVLETEIWPNLFNEAKRSGAGLLIVNGRISDRAFPSYQQMRWFFAPVLALPDAILTQSPEDRRRYIELGAPPDRAKVGGNLKFDFDPHRVTVAPDLQEYLRATPAVWVAASTMPPALPGDPDEDDAVLDAWEQVRRPGLRLVLVPRKPERFDLAADKLRARGIPFTRRSGLSAAAAEDVLLLDSVGELAGVFRYATVVFMGGTLASRGGHNILEPAAFGKPVIVGPHMENFREIAAKFTAASAVIEIADAGQLAAAVRGVLEGQADRIGERARLVADSERGATERAVEAAVHLRLLAVPHVLPYGPLHPFLRLLSLLWRTGGWLARSRTQRRRLSTPVVSIGGIAMGGAGKTPLVRWLARELHTRGYAVAVLTRGYRRRHAEPVTVLEAGSSAPVDLTGEEAQSILRDGYAHLGIGADRYRSGRALEEQSKPDVFLLDDGFQHARLARDLDIVVLDDVDPYGGGEVFPLGRLREPASALLRADLVVRKRLRFAGWVPELPVAVRVSAYCGLGNPGSFWAALDRLGLTVANRHTFRDHHRYTAEQIRRMLAGVDVLVTTEKDFYNTPPGFPVHYLRVEFEPEDPATLLELVEGRVRALDRKQ